MESKEVFVSGASGFIGNAVARAFRRAGWTTYGMVRDAEHANALARNEIHPVVGSTADLSFLSSVAGKNFEVIVSNTEDARDPGTHLAQVRSMLLELTRQQGRPNKRPLVMFTSGSKDYGEMAERHGAPSLSPHTESSPIRPHPFAATRASFASSLLQDGHESFDVTVLRPVLVYGYKSGLYGLFFDLAAKSRGVLELMADPDTILHSVHVDDCADAYVKLAEHSNRAEIIGKAFNISNSRYETTFEIANALAKSYGLRLRFEAPPAEVTSLDVHTLGNSSQWVSSELLRATTGWREHRPLFTEGISEYRLAYEASKR